MLTTQLYAFACYLGILVLIAILAKKFHKKSDLAADYAVGGRSLNFWVTAISAQASDMSSWLFMALPMMIYTGGLGNGLIAIGLVLGMAANWHFLAPKLRQASEDYDSLTISSYLRKRFPESKSLTLLSTIATLIFVTHYLAAGLIAMGFLFEQIFQFDYHFGICIASMAVVFYTLLGGYSTVAWTDFFQGMFLLFMIILVPSIAVTKLPSLGEIVSAAGPRLHLAPEQIPQKLLLALSWGLGYFGMPHILSKFLGIDQVSAIRKAKYLGTSWQVLSLIAACSVGIVAWAYYPQLSNPELVFVMMVQDLFPAFLSGLILCGVLAATISTMDSQILVLSSAISEDLYHTYFNPQASSLQRLKIARLSTAGVSLLAIILAWPKDKTISDSVFYAWTGLGCSFGPVLLTSLYSKKISAKAAIYGLSTGLLIAFIWPQLPSNLTSIFPGAMIPGFSLSLFIILAKSYLDKKQPAT